MIEDFFRYQHCNLTIFLLKAKLYILKLNILIQNWYMYSYYDIIGLYLLNT